MSSWGVDALWGLDTWGGATLGISLVSAFPITTHQVRVALSSEPSHAGNGQPGDALNSRTWSVVRNDTNLPFNILGVAEVNPTTYDLLTYEALGPFSVPHVVSTSNLLALTGETVTAPESITFPGLVDKAIATPQALAATRRFGVRDVANPPFPVSGSVAGALVITPQGDYALDEGPESARKRIYRRLFTRKGEFWHLKDYGLGVAEKEPVPGNLVVFQAEVERQLLQEDDFATVSAAVMVDASNTLTILVSAVLKQTGQEIQVSFTPSSSGVSF